MREKISVAQMDMEMIRQGVIIKKVEELKKLGLSDEEINKIFEEKGVDQTILNEIKKTEDETIPEIPIETTSENSEGKEGKENAEYEAKKAEIEKRRQEELKRISFDELMAEFEHNNHRLIGVRAEIGDSTFRIIDVDDIDQEVIIDYIKPDNTHSNFGLKIGNEKTFKKYKEKYKDVDWSDENINDKYDTELIKLKKQLKKGEAENARREQVENSTNQEKINAVFDKLIESIIETKKLEEKLTEIIVLEAERDKNTSEFFKETKDKKDTEQNKENDLLKSKEGSEKREVFSYKIDIIKEEIHKILFYNEHINKIYKLDIDGAENKINIKGAIEGIKKTFLKDIKVDISINAELINNGDNIIISQYNLDAGILTPLIKPIIEKNLNTISDKIKEFIKKKENKKVEKIWIEGGELKAN